MFIKLISKANEWYVQGTEVWHYDEDRRLTEEEYNSWNPYGTIRVRGVHEYDDGTQYIDGESCSLDEFEDVVFVEDDGKELIKEYRRMY